MKNEVKYYLAASILLPVAAIQGVWTAAKQLPSYVRSSVRSAKSTLDEAYKTEVTGKSQRERRMDAIFGNARKNK